MDVWYGNSDLENKQEAGAAEPLQYTGMVAHQGIYSE